MKFFKKTDIVIIAAILLVSLTSWLIYDSAVKGGAVKAEIYYYSELVETVSLDHGIERTFSILQDPSVVFHLDKEGRIAFIASDCPDKVCIHTGKLCKAGQYAACLPNGIVLKIVPAGERDKEDADIIL